MKMIWKQEFLQEFIFADLFGADEIVRKYGKYGLISFSGIEIKREFCCYHSDINGNLVKEKIDETEYFENEYYSNYKTYLNYTDFLKRFDVNDFYRFLENTYFPKELDKIFPLLIDYVNSGNNLAAVMGDLRYVSNYIFECIDELTHILTNVNFNKELNEIQKFVIEEFISKYQGILQQFKSHYEDILDEEYINKIFTPYEDRDKEDNNPHTDIFKTNKTYLKFKEYLKKFVIEPYIDHSYLFQRMINEKLIHSTRHKDYMDWLYDNNFIYKKDYNHFLNQRSFRTLNKSSSTMRINQFNITFLE